jgi:putative transposase
MARKALIDSRTLPYHISARVNNRERFPGELDYAWIALTNELYIQSQAHGVLVHAFVLMPNHFHLIVTSPERSIDRVMKDVLANSTKIMNAKLGRCGRIFGGPYHWSLIPNPLYYAYAFKYVARNPVRAHLCESVSDYPFSSISCLLGKGKLPIAVHYPLETMGTLLPPIQESYAPLENWLNTPSKAETDLAIRKALRRRTFELNVSREKRKKMKLEPPLDAASLPEST